MTILYKNVGYVTPKPLSNSTRYPLHPLATVAAPIVYFVFFTKVIIFVYLFLYFIFFQTSNTKFHPIIHAINSPTVVYA